MNKFDSFREFYETMVKPLYMKRQTRLDGREKGGSTKEFARFRYRYKYWRVHEDTHVEQLQRAYRLLQAGEEPFEIGVSKRGNKPCLTLKGAEEGEEKFFYAYQLEEK